MAQLDLPAARSGGSVLGGRIRLRRLDWTLIAAVIGLSIFGLMMVYSSTHRTLALFHLSSTYYVKRQGIFLLLGLGAMLVTAAIDYRLLKALAPLAYGGVVLLLLAVRTPLGSSQLGSQRWFSIAGFQLSPSMFARIGLVLMLAAFLSDIQGPMTLPLVIRTIAIAAIPMGLVFIQPDIGTTIILATILVAMLVVAGTRARLLVVLALAATLAIFGAFQLHIVKQYQVARLTDFLNQSGSSQAANYNLQQSMIAIGSGGVTGTGYLHGTQTNLDFVPEQYADFIFTVVGEELGFVGAVGLLFLYGLLLWRAYRIALLAKDPFGTFIATGVAATFAIQMFVNIGMTIGIMPITGIPLPFMSYGGSALIADCIGVGLLLSVRMRTFD